MLAMVEEQNIRELTSLNFLVKGSERKRNRDNIPLVCSLMNMFEIVHKSSANGQLSSSSVS